MENKLKYECIAWSLTVENLEIRMAKIRELAEDK